jgi:diadenylate cyclase
MDTIQFISIISDLRFRDILDVLLITIVAYHLYLWFWGTKAFKALVGLLVLGVIFTVSRSWGLFFTNWVFQILWQVLVILIIILFQSEIRQVLEKVNPLQMIGLRAYSKPTDWIPNFVKAVFSMARRSIGALMIIERMDLAEEWITGGIQLEAEAAPELLLSIFQKESPLHDGAVLIKGGKVAKAACYLPLSSAEGVPQNWGTRHRAALGLSERCDACVVVVSEERGEVAVAMNGQMFKIRDGEQLSEFIVKAVTVPHFTSAPWWEKIRLLVLRRWPVKLGSFVLVSIIWLMLAGQQNFQATLKVPLEVKNLPPGMEIVAPVNPEIEITVQGLRKDVSALNRRNVSARIDLSEARYGKRLFHITREEITLPSDSGSIIAIDPPQMEFTLREIPAKS